MVPQSVPPPPDVAAAPPGAQQTASGLLSVVLKAAPAGIAPGPDDLVKVKYDAWTKAGVLFDSTSFRGPQIKPVEARSVTRGWTEALRLMSVGEKRRFWIPPQLAYGSEDADSGLPTGQVTYDIELLEIDRAPEVPPAPASVNAAPSDAIRTSSGLAYRVLAKGDGTYKPRPEDEVEVVFTGWTSEGKVFDSSVPQRAPKRYTVGRLIPGWTEGLRGMVQGERRLFWIPAALAHGEGAPNVVSKKPLGNLVVDVELVRILPRARVAANR